MYLPKLADSVPFSRKEQNSKQAFKNGSTERNRKETFDNFPFLLNKIKKSQGFERAFA